MTKFLKYTFGTLISPRKTFNELLQDPDRFNHGTAVTIFVGILYTITVISGYLNGFGAIVKPWIPLSPKDYYYYEIFFCLPLFILLTLVCAAVIQFLSIFLKGNGTFEDCIALCGFSLWIPILPLMWFPETINMIFFPDLRTQALGGIFGIPGWLDAARIYIDVLWMLILTIIAIKLIQRISWPKAVFVGLTAFIPTYIISFTYIR